MAQETISIRERELEETLVNEEIKVDGSFKKVYDVQYEPLTRQILFQFTDGTTYTAHEDSILTFKKDVKRPRIKPKNGRIK